MAKIAPKRAAPQGMPKSIPAKRFVRQSNVGRLEAMRVFVSSTSKAARLVSPTTTSKSEEQRGVACGRLIETSSASVNLQHPKAQ
eukprot:1847731-Pleurochrysis_carterae.AAC.2